MKRIGSWFALTVLLLSLLTGCVVRLDPNDFVVPGKPDTGSSTASTTTAGTTTTGGSADLLSRDEAKNIAFQNAGVSAADVRNLQIELDRDDGVISYEIEFRSGRTEYQYDIHAKTGKILERDVDYYD